MATRAASYCSGVARSPDHGQHRVDGHHAPDEERDREEAEEGRQRHQREPRRRPGPSRQHSGAQEAGHRSVPPLVRAARVRNRLGLCKRLRQHPPTPRGRDPMTMLRTILMGAAAALPLAAIAETPRRRPGGGAEHRRHRRARPRAGLRVHLGGDRHQRLRPAGPVRRGGHDRPGAGPRDGVGDRRGGQVHRLHPPRGRDLPLRQPRPPRGRRRLPRPRDRAEPYPRLHPRAARLDARERPRDGHGRGQHRPPSATTASSHPPS